MSAFSSASNQSILLFYYYSIFDPITDRLIFYLYFCVLLFRQGFAPQFRRYDAVFAVFESGFDVPAQP